MHAGRGLTHVMYKLKKQIAFLLTSSIFNFLPLCGGVSSLKRIPGHASILLRQCFEDIFFSRIFDYTCLRLSVRVKSNMVY